MKILFLLILNVILFFSCKNKEKIKNILQKESEDYLYKIGLKKTFFDTIYYKHIDFDNRNYEDIIIYKKILPWKDTLHFSLSRDNNAEYFYYINSNYNYFDKKNKLKNKNNVNIIKSYSKNLKLLYYQKKIDQDYKMKQNSIVLLNFLKKGYFEIHKSGSNFLVIQFYDYISNSLYKKCSKQGAIIQFYNDGIIIKPICLIYPEYNSKF